MPEIRLRLMGPLGRLAGGRGAPRGGDGGGAPARAPGPPPRRRPRPHRARVRGRQPMTTDQWIASTCGLCYGTCSIRAPVVDGVLVQIEGNPESAIGRGRLCGKGVAGIMT